MPIILHFNTKVLYNIRRSRDRNFKTKGNINEENLRNFGFSRNRFSIRW
jgi:hypothetical protein